MIFTNLSNNIHSLLHLHSVSIYKIFLLLKTCSKASPINKVGLSLYWMKHIHLLFKIPVRVHSDHHLSASSWIQILAGPSISWDHWVSLFCHLKWRDYMILAFHSSSIMAFLAHRSLQMHQNHLFQFLRVMNQIHHPQSWMQEPKTMVQ